MKAGDLARVAVRSGLLVAPLVFLIEATWILVNAGGFLRHDLAFFATLCRYLGYGATLSLAAAVVSFPVARRLSPPAAVSLLFGSIVSAFFAIEVGLYVLDIVAPVRTTPLPRLLQLVAIVLVLAAGLTLLALLLRRQLWNRLAGILAAGRWRRVLLLCAAECALALLVVQATGALLEHLERHGSPAAGRPNVLLIVLDTVRADALSSSGNPLADTPYLDRLASEGIRFSRAVSTSTWTPPGHASLFTGLYPISHGTRGPNMVLSEDLDTLSSEFGRAGFATLSLSNNPLLKRSTGMLRGFNLAVGVEIESKVSFADERLYYKYVLGDRGARRTWRLLDAWIRENHRRHVPWLAFINFTDAHSPYAPREPWMDEFLRRMGAGIAKGTHRFPFRPVSRHRARMLPRAGQPVSDTEAAWLRAAYYSGVRALDEEMGRALDPLRSDGILDDTIVIVTADHGEALGESGQWGHTNGVFPSVVRIPLIIWAPNRLEPRVDHRWASLVDILPTLLELSGLDSKPRRQDFQGHSLLRADRPDETAVEHVDPEPPHCETFLLLRGILGAQFGCDGQVSLISVSEDSLNAWGTPSASPSAESWREDLLRWRTTCLANRSPTAAVQSLTDAQREQLRGLGYLK